MPAPWLPPVPYECIKFSTTQGELQNVVVALISRKSISAGRSGLSKGNNRDECQEALREREVLWLRLPLVQRSQVPGKRGWKSQVAQPGWSSRCWSCTVADSNPGSKAVVYDLMERMAETPSRMKRKVGKS